MFGNKFGWGISAGIVIVYVGLIAMLFLSSGISPPTELGSDPANFAPITLNPAPESLMPMDQAQDAGPVYRKAIAAYDEAAYDIFRHKDRPTPDEAKALPGMQYILQAAPYTLMRLFVTTPESIINYDNRHPDLDAIQDIGQTAVQASLAFKAANDNNDAVKYLKAAFSLGTKLYEERLTFDEFYAGASIMSGAATMLAELDPSMADSWNAEIQSLKDNTVKTQTLQKQIAGVDGDMIAEHAGDVFVFVDKAKEKMWRVEEILALGRMRFNIGENGRKGDQLGAIRRVRELCKSQDSAIHAAAQAASDLTLEKYNTISG